MTQSKKNSIKESTANVIIGLLCSFLIQVILYPRMGLKVTVGQNIFITMVFFVVSFIRGYLIRRIFNRLDK